jgi:hypothetical protein
MLVGAGATLSQAQGRPKVNQPPLDIGFFGGAKRAGTLGWRPVAAYMTQHYGTDITRPPADSLEQVMSVIYSDIHHGSLKAEAVSTFRNLLALLNRRLAETTNGLEPTNQSPLYRLFCTALEDGRNPSEMTVITFNQDLQIERVLERLEATAKWRSKGALFDFPRCYQLANVSTTSGGRGVRVFSDAANPGGIPILKLHGSLNWYSRHISRAPSTDTLLNARRGLFVTRRRSIAPDMMYHTGRRRMYTFPIVVPPVTHKAAIMHNALADVWRMAENALLAADELIVFGYSCPSLDFESANLIARTMRQKKVLRTFSVIDPSPATFQRYVEVTGLKSLLFYRSASAYLAAP